MPPPFTICCSKSVKSVLPNEPAGRWQNAVGFLIFDLADSQCCTFRRAIYRGQETTPKMLTALRDRPMVQGLQQAMPNHKELAVFRKPSDHVFASAGWEAVKP